MRVKSETLIEQSSQTELTTVNKDLQKSFKAEIKRRIFKNKLLYLMILPGLLYLIIYKYIPMFGLVISFQNYKPYQGILGSEWVGFEHFTRLFTDSDFWMILRNTLVLFGLHILDRKSTRLNSSHVKISYAVFCLKKKKKR